LGIIKQIDYDPIKYTYILLICFQNGILNYKIGIYNLKLGFYIQLGNNVFIQNGNSMMLKKIPLGVYISCITLYQNTIFKLIRASGCFAVVLQRIPLYTLIKLKSLEKRYFLSNNIVTIGRISNINHFLRNLRKAGYAFWLNIKPKVRGVAMNPVDHPNGGKTPGKIYTSK
jgi:large subunit ribosomal protein L2